ncbi:MAG: MerR family transcriptional regulator [Burkholderiaceae bacterium]|nr:MerR family transcriptional regulator [Burkholderiaceae bacterium]
MNEGELSLRELSARTGIEPRTIRGYIQQGLLRGPSGYGRKASYGASHERRLRAIRVLKDLDHKPLAEIRMELFSASDAEIDAIAARLPAPSDDVTRELSGAASALDYLSKVKRAMGGAWAANEGVNGPGGSAPLTRTATAQERDLPTLESAASTTEGSLAADLLDGGTDDAVRRSPLAAALDRLAADRRIARKARGELWSRIPILPDIDLSIRGGRSPEELAQFERLADLLREFLMGDSDDPKDS